MDIEPAQARRDLLTYTQMQISMAHAWAPGHVNRFSISRSEWARQMLPPGVAASARKR